MSNVIKLHHFIDKNESFRVQIILFWQPIYLNSFKIGTGDVFEIKEMNISSISYNNVNKQHFCFKISMFLRKNIIFIVNIPEKTTKFMNIQETTE